MQFTLNDYECEGLEPHVSKFSHRIDTFKRIVDTYGIGHAVWRFDPLILTDTINEDVLLDRISNIATQLRGYADRLVFSFADIAGYRKVSRNLDTAGVKYREWTPEQMKDFAKRLSDLNLGLQLATCSEAIDLEQYGIVHNHCIDPDLIARLSPDDTALQMWLFGAVHDKGQRTHCGCILSKDIGAYNTCPHGCLYCYANSSPCSALSNYQKLKVNHIPDSLIL